MRRYFCFTLFFCIATAVSTHAQDIVVVRKVRCLENYHGGSVELFVNDWHVLSDKNILEKAVNEGRDVGLSKCASEIRTYREAHPYAYYGETLYIAVFSKVDRSSKVDGLVIFGGEAEVAGEAKVAQATWDRNNGKYQGPIGGHDWRDNTIVPLLAKEENNRRTEGEQRRAALAYCGAEPTISGGPWFSSTYKVAARDEAQRAFFCVKTIEYISDAVNPFGGKAARARFSGYKQQTKGWGAEATPTYESVNEVRDFPY